MGCICFQILLQVQLGLEILQSCNFLDQLVARRLALAYANQAFLQKQMGNDRTSLRPSPPSHDPFVVCCQVTSNR